MFKTKPNPTFMEPAEIPTAGDAPQTLRLFFRHKRRSEVKNFFDRAAQLAGDPEKELDLLMEIIAGWEDADVEFSRQALGDVLENYHGAVAPIFQAYTRGLLEGRKGN